MTTTLDRPTLSEPVPPTPKHRSPIRHRRPLVVLAAFVVLVLLAALAAVLLHRRWDDADRHYLGADGWPVHGQGAYAVGAMVHASPGESAVPIASLAKVMTAWLVLRDAPLHGGSGFTLTVTSRDVRDTARRRAQQQSIVDLRAGERLTERQALLAVLLPSANNVAAMLARHIAGSEGAFVAHMNRAAAALGMQHTRYTDPSGFRSTTVSTAHDQTLLARAVGRDATFDALVARRSARLPIVGTVHNTDFLLDRDGFVGTKTGSDDAAGGCFMFRTWRVIDERAVPVVGVVLEQQGHSFVAAGQYAARQLADRVSSAVPA